MLLKKPSFTDPVVPIWTFVILWGLLLEADTPNWWQLKLTVLLVALYWKLPPVIITELVLSPSVTSLPKMVVPNLWPLAFSAFIAYPDANSSPVTLALNEPSFNSKASTALIVWKFKRSIKLLEVAGPNAMFDICIWLLPAAPKAPIGPPYQQCHHVCVLHCY